jgi:hypothetical protein
MATFRTRHRHIPDYVDHCPGGVDRIVERDHFTGLLLSDTTVQTPGSSVPPPTLRGQETTSDENHFDELKSYKAFEFHGDIGGDFYSYKRTALAYPGKRQHLSWSGRNSTTGRDVIHTFDGAIFPLAPNVLPAPPEPVDSNLAPVGTTAIARCKPTNNVANLATDLVETRRQGLPHLYGASLWERKTLDARNAGHEYLNSEFGWKPLVSDLRNASYAAANAHKLLEAYARNSGKLVRRRYEFPVTKSESTALYSVNQDGYPHGIRLPSGDKIYDTGVNQGNVYRTTRTYLRQWFSGAFTYHLPVGFNSHNEVIRAGSRAGPLLGIELTPEVVWNAEPWTWALDWFSNIGDCVSIYSDMAVDGLVIKYGYVMEHKVTSYTYTFVGRGRYSPHDDSHHPDSITFFVETKRRVRATPFGFGLTWNGLTLRQLAIAAALGLTRW